MNNIYNAIQNLYNMDKDTWQEVLSELYNLVNATNQKFDVFEQKFLLHLGNEVTKELKKMYDDGSLYVLVNDVFKDFDTKINSISTQLNEKAPKEELDVERKRIDSFVSLPEGSTSGDAELIDGRISYSGVTYTNIGSNIRNIDSTVNGTVLGRIPLLNADYETLTSMRDENGQLYLEYIIKKGDVLEFDSECVGEHAFTLTTTIPLDRAKPYTEVIKTTGNVITRRIVADGNYTGIFIWANDITQLRKVTIKKIVFQDNLLDTTKIGVLSDCITKNTLANYGVTGFTNNIVYIPMTLEKGKTYRINVSTKIKNKYSLFTSTDGTKNRASINLVSDLIDNTTNLLFSPPMTYNYLAVYEEKSVANNIHLVVEEIEFYNSHRGQNERTIYIASSNSSDFDKASADFICNGSNDEYVINKAIDLLIYGGTIQLLDGDYYFDEFSTMNNSCVFIQNNGFGRTITIKGTTENKSYLSRYGVTIHVTEKAYSKLQDGIEYSVFNTSHTKVPLYQVECYPNNINFENFYIFLYNNQKKVIGINGSNFGSMSINQVGVYHKDYFYYRFNRLRPETPVEGCIGILSVKGANDEMAKIYMNCVNSGGLWCGIKIKGVEHLIMNTCTCSRGTYGYIFEGRCDKTLTVINCADEGNRHLPIFKNTGSASIIDFCIERLHDDVIPFDPTGDTEPLATEDTASGWKGFLSYRVQGNALGVYKFWKDGHGRGFKTVNLSNELCGTTKPKDPDYLCEFFDTTTNKMLRWNGTNWVDSMGNVVS